MIDKRYIDIAIQLAQKSSFQYSNGSVFRLGALAFRSGRIVSRGHNIKTVNNFFKNFGYRYSIHAESLALFRCGMNADELLVVRILKDNSLSMALPCEKCNSMIKKSGVKTIYYSYWDGSIQKIVL